MKTQTITHINTLENFVKQNLSGKIFDMAFSSDKDLLLELMYSKEEDEFNAVDFLEQFKALSVKDNALRNHEISKNISIERMKISIPTTGDMLIDDEGNKFYIAKIYDNHFQYAKSGSFYIGSSGSGSFSGGYSFDAIMNGSETGYFKSHALEEVKDQEEHGRFWFFMDNRSGAHRGVYFNSKVRVWKFKKD